MPRRFQFSLGRCLVALGLVVCAWFYLDPVFRGSDIMGGWQMLFMPAALLFGYVAISVLCAPPLANPIDDSESRPWRCFAPLRRPQFSLKTLLWLMVVVAAFYAGDRRARNLYLASVGQWYQQLHSQSDQNRKLQVENTMLRRQIDADHQRWLREGRPATRE